MRHLKIFTKLFLSHGILGLFAIISLSLIFYTLLSQALLERTLDQLSSINILKKSLIENYLFRSTQNLEALQVENKFVKIYHDLTDDVPHPEKEHDLTDIQNLTKFYDFKNIHLFDRKHRQLFSTDKEMYPEGLLSKIDSTIEQNPKKLRVIDASTYSTDSHTLLFYYVPVVENEELLGIVLVQENFQKIQLILSETTGMGETGESYIAGDDYTMRSASRFFPDKQPGDIQVTTEAVTNAIEGHADRGILDDYRGISVLSAYRKIENPDLQWAIISEMDEGEAMLPILRLRNSFIVITILMIIVAGVITYFLSNAIVRPVLQLKSIILTLSKGIVPVQKPTKSSNDEIGEMAQSIVQLTEGLERTAVFATEIGSGNFDAPFTTLSDKDVLGQALLHMRDELRGFHDKELRSVRARAAALLEGQENERRRIIKELHDGVGQMLTAIRMQIDMLEDVEEKDAIKSQLNDVISEVKRISYHVMPQAIVDFGLEAALQGLCDTTTRYSSLSIDFRYIRETDHQIDFDTSIALFRIAQEGLNNIVKHASASEVILHILDKEEEVYFILEDNGKGFDAEHLNNYPGSGLKNIKERAKLLSGTADVISAADQGTTIEIHIPHKQFDEQH